MPASQPTPDSPVSEQQRLVIRRAQMLLDRALSGEIEGLVYVAQSPNGPLYEGAVGRMHVPKTCHALLELRLDLSDRHARGLTGD